jgi:hypothetical protein
LARRLSPWPSRATAAPASIERHSPLMKALTRPRAGEPAPVPPPRATRNPGALRIPPDGVHKTRGGAPLRVRAIPLGTATQLRSAVRMMIILAPPRSASPPRLDASPRSDAVTSPGAGEWRRR